MDGFPYYVRPSLSQFRLVEKYPLSTYTSTLEKKHGKLLRLSSVQGTIDDSNEWLRVVIPMSLPSKVMDGLAFTKFFKTSLFLYWNEELILRKKDTHANTIFFHAGKLWKIILLILILAIGLKNLRIV